MKLLMIMLLVAISPTALAKSQLEDLLDRATTIAVVNVIEGHKANELNDRRCQYVYTIETEKLIRGSPRVYKLATQAKLKVGERYFVMAAENTIWELRALGNDVVTPPWTKPNEHNLCQSKLKHALIADPTEIFDISTNILNNDWIWTLPHMLQAPKSVSQMNEEQHIDIGNGDENAPGPTVRHYFLLRDVLTLIKPAF